MVVYNVNQVSLRQAITPPRLQGRMNASMRWFVWGTIPIGALIGGALGTLIGVRETLVIAAIGESFAFLPVLLSPVRRIREMPVQVEDPQPGRGSPGLDAPLGGDRARVDRGDERRVVALGLVGVGARERDRRLVERRVLPEVAADGRRIAGPGMTAGERPAAQPGPVGEVVGRHRLDHGRTLGVLELPDIQVPARRTGRPAEQDVARRLEPALADDDAPAVVLRAGSAREPLEDRRLGLLDLEEQRIVGVVAEQEDDPGAEADAPDADDLERRVDRSVVVEQDAAILLERRAIVGERRADQRRGGLRRVGDDGRAVHDPERGARAGRDPWQLVERVVVRRPP